MTYKSEVGQLGEDVACEFLIKNGYQIIDRNFKKPWGELDVIAKAPDKTLVFIEVKTVRHYPNQKIQPEEQLTKAKFQKLKRTASLYAGLRQDLIKDEKGWRIDLLALRVDSGRYSINHYENIA
jgi:putative endonuclease